MRKAILSLVVVVFAVLIIPHQLVAQEEIKAALEKNDLDAVRKSVELLGTDFKGTSIVGWYLVNVDEFSADVLAYLLDHGGDPNMVDESTSGRPSLRPIVAALLYQPIDALKLLVKAKANLNIRQDEAGYLPIQSSNKLVFVHYSCPLFYWALRANDPEKMLYLLNSGMKVDNTLFEVDSKSQPTKRPGKYSALETNMLLGDWGSISILLSLKGFSIPIPEQYRTAPYFIAKGDLEGLKKSYLAYKGEPSGLMKAAIDCRNVEALKLLLELQDSSRMAIGLNQPNNATSGGSPLAYCLLVGFNDGAKLFPEIMEKSLGNVLNHDKVQFLDFEVTKELVAFAIYCNALSLAENLSPVYRFCETDNPELPIQIYADVTKSGYRLVNPRNGQEDHDIRDINFYSPTKLLKLGEELNAQEVPAEPSQER